MRLRRVLSWIRAWSLKTQIIVAVVLLAIIGAVSYGGRQVYTYTQEDAEFCRSCHTMEKAWDRWETSEHRNITCHNCHQQSPVKGMELVVKYVVQRPDAVSEHAFVPDSACKKCHESGDPKWIQVEETAGHQVHVGEQRIACTKCHSVTLHRFEPPQKVCSLCHGEKRVTVQPMAEFHCTSCHSYLTEEHDLKPTRKECLACHSTLAPTKVNWPADAPMQFECGQCHKPHAAVKPIVDCQSCHEDVKSKGLHSSKIHAAATCTTCHKPHEWKVTKRDTCVSCHQDRVEHNKGANCATCHSYKGAEPGAAPKPSGQATPVASPAAGPPTIPHTIKDRADCLACHEKGLRSAPKYQEDHANRTNDSCQLCHKPSS
ncbi:MAG: NapC/NirT family cytochrome c [Chloroflexi bacterium]|nr:NapC/NirT family cytochrome c [Chloroflexota bacterium]